MGSFSVPCALSGVTITEGQPMGMIPLIKHEYARSHCFKPGFDPFCLPLWGFYDDYGRIRFDTKDENVLLVESVVGDINDFCYSLTDGEQYDEERDKPKFDISNMTHCFVHRDIFEGSAKITQYSRHIGVHFDVGNHNVLTHLGFTLQEEKGPDERYNKVYTKGDYTLYSDGHWCYKADKRGIYDVMEMKKFGCDVSYFKGKSWQHIWRILDPYTVKKMLFNSFGAERFSFQLDDELFDRIMGELGDGDSPAYRVFKEKRRDSIPKMSRAYLETESEYIKDLAADFITVTCNLYPASRQIEPYGCCITPQCGEHEAHLDYVKMIAKVLKDKIKEYQ